MTALYVETSALVRALVGSDTAVASAMREATDLVTSALTGLEAARAIARLRRDGHLSPAGERDSLRRLAEFERSAGTRSIDDEVLRAARREFPAEPVRSLDAIHLATLSLLDAAEEQIAVLSTDRRVRENALAMGFEVLPRDEGA